MKRKKKIMLNPAVILSEDALKLIQNTPEDNEFDKKISEIEFKMAEEALKRSEKRKVAYIS